MRLSALILAIVCGHAAAQEFQPYAEARITAEQWDRYFSLVASQLAASRREQAEMKLVFYENRATGTSYAFTQPGHPAHPAWIVRQEDAAGPVRQTGYFAGDEGAFADLFADYPDLRIP